MMECVVYCSRNKLGIQKVRSTVAVLPRNSSDSVVVRVFAAGVNPVDYKIGSGIPVVSFLRQNVPVGTEFAGVVVAANEGNSGGYKVGDKVYGNSGAGSYCQLLLVECERIAKMPEKLSFVEAASLPTVALSALQALRNNRHHVVDNGSRVMIVGASGGCGSAAVQIAKALGASLITAICSSRNNEFVKSLGSDEIVNYDTDEGKLALKRLNELQTENDKYDVIFDTVTSVTPSDPDYEEIVGGARRRNGVWVAVNTKASFNWVRNQIGFQRNNYHLFLVSHNHEDLLFINKLIEEGKYRPVIQKIFNVAKPLAALENNNNNNTVNDDLKDTTSEVFDIEEVYNAFNESQGRRVIGKLVLTLKCNQEYKS